MKQLIRYLSVMTIAAGLAFAPAAALAGDCCTKAAEATKKGKSCEKCIEHACCKTASKEAAKQAAKEGKAKTCEKCAKKEKKKDQA